MKRVTLTIAALGLAATFATASEPSSLVGHWHGAGQSETDNRFIVPCVDEIMPVANNRFLATFTLDESEIIPCVFPVDAAISETGVVTGNGIDSHGHRVLLHGKTRLMGDGSVRIAAFKYKVFQWHGGVIDDGNLAMLQMIGGEDWDTLPGAHVDADFRGLHSPDGSRDGGEATALLFNVGDRTAGPTTMFGGVLSMLGVQWNAPPDPVQPGLFDFEFQLGGTVGLPAVQTDGSTRAPFGAIGFASPPDPVMPNGIIAILIGAVEHPEDAGGIIPCIIPGEYRLYDGFGDVFQDVFHGTNSSFNDGVFRLAEEV